jgi:hypothetical protein
LLAQAGLFEKVFREHAAAAMVHYYPTDEAAFDEAFVANLRHSMQK